MPIRLSGLSSGMDTDSMVKELVKASSAKKDKLVKAQTKLGWKQTAWQEMNTKIYNNFFLKTLDAMRSQGNYNKRTTTVADPTVASVVAGANAANGTQTLAVDKLATAGALTGKKLSSNKSYTKNSTMEALGALSAGDTAKIKVTVGGKETSINLTSDMTIDTLTTKLNAAGVIASFDEENQRIFINSKKSGAAGEFTLAADNTNGLTALSGLGLLSKEDVTNNPEYRLWADLKGINDDETLVNLQNAGKISAEVAARVAALKKNNESLSKSNEGITDIIDELNRNKTLYLGTDQFKDAMKAADPTETLTLDENITNLNGKVEQIKKDMNRFKELDAKKATDEGLTPAEEEEYRILGQAGTDGAWDTLPGDEKNLAILNEAKNYDTEIKAQEDKRDANIAQMNANNDRIGSTTDGSGTVLPGTGTGTALLEGEVEADLVDKVNASAEAIRQAGLITGGGDSSVRIMGTDAEITLNGAKFTSSSNVFSVNGLTITAKSVSAIDPGTNKAINTTINTEVDTEGIYNQIKNFFKEYNKLIIEMDSKYNAVSSKGYEPLTSEEKEALSETEIKEWEAKIKDSLLKRDSDLGSISSMFKTTMMQGIEINGKKLSLLSYGIETQSYFNAADNEKSAYHIAGDADDTVSFKETDKLKKAIIANPDEVGEFFSKFTTTLYDELNEEMKFVKDYRSTFKVYDDKKMASDYKDYTDKIKAQEKKLTALEDRYYKQFTAMEKAMSKLNSTQNSFSALLGAG